MLDGLQGTTTFPISAGRVDERHPGTLRSSRLRAPPPGHTEEFRQIFDATFLTFSATVPFEEVGLNPSYARPPPSSQQLLCALPPAESLRLLLLAVDGFRTAHGVQLFSAAYINQFPDGNAAVLFPPLVPSVRPSCTHQRPIPQRAHEPHPEYPIRMKLDDSSYWYHSTIPRDPMGMFSGAAYQPGGVAGASMPAPPTRPPPLPFSQEGWSARSSDDCLPSLARTPSSPNQAQSSESGSSYHTEHSKSTDAVGCSKSEQPAWQGESVPGLIASTASTSEGSSEYTRPVSPRSSGSGPESSSTVACGYNLKKRRTRVLMTRIQTMELNAVWLQHKFPITSDREALARKIGLTPRQVQVWFQNQRQKYRRQVLQYRGQPPEDPDSPSFEHFPLSPTHPAYAQEGTATDRVDDPASIDRWRQENPYSEPPASTSGDNAQARAWTTDQYFSRPHTPYDRPSVLQPGPSPLTDRRPSVPPHSVHPLPSILGDRPAQLAFEEAHCSSALYREPPLEQERLIEEQRWGSIRQNSRNAERIWIQQRSVHQPPPRHTSSGIVGVRPTWGSVGHRPHTNPVSKLAPLNIPVPASATQTLPSIRSDFSSMTHENWYNSPSSTGLSLEFGDVRAQYLHENSSHGAPSSLPPGLASLLIENYGRFPPSTKSVSAEGSSPTPSPPSASTIKGTRDTGGQRLPGLKELFE